MIQLVLRALFLWILFHSGPQRLQYLVVADAIASLLLFLFFFRPFLILTLQQL
ncbi:MAG TPA: hypothetical protein VJ203_14675 [Bacteroidales bacterium]|nr:hypothetical protein [Bacteroidales bacterium]